MREKEGGRSRERERGCLLYIVEADSMISCRYSHCVGKTTLSASYLHNSNSYIYNTIFLNRALCVSQSSMYQLSCFSDKWWPNVWNHKGEGGERWEVRERWHRKRWRRQSCTRYWWWTGSSQYNQIVKTVFFEEGPSLILLIFVKDRAKLDLRESQPNVQRIEVDYSNKDIQRPILLAWIRNFIAHCTIQADARSCLD